MKNQKIKIFQIYFDEYSKSKVSDYFIPFDNSNSTNNNDFEYFRINDNNL